MNRNSTSPFLAAPQETYWGQFEDISKYNVHLNIFERLWAAWYAYMQNDVLATGIMSFTMHEVVYFGRSIPWAIIDRIPYFNKYKIQNVSLGLLLFILAFLSHDSIAKDPYLAGAMELRQTGAVVALHGRTSTNLVRSCWSLESRYY